MSTATSKLGDPTEALAALLRALTPVDTHTLALHHAAGRVLAQPLTTDRPSPPCDVSAMDGYALRLSDSRGRVPVADEVQIGSAPPELPPGAALRIFTGGAVPADADIVIRREDVTETQDEIFIPDDLDLTPGQNIRRRGENAPAGAPVLQPGQLITPPVAAALATFGVSEPSIHRRVRLTIIVTGNELVPPHVKPQQWQIRDSNGHTLVTMFSPLPWVECLPLRYAVDDKAALRTTVAAALPNCDALLLTGGVSMGDHDHVPAVLDDLGARTVFHKLALRPGKPLLGALGPDGQAILGLPGNPVSVMVTARRFALAALRKRAGFTQPDPPASAIQLDNPDTKTLSLTWHRPVRLTVPGRAVLLPSRGSGDMVSAAASDGFVEVPPGAAGQGPWPFYPW